MQPWTSGEATLTHSRTYLEDSHGLEHWEIRAQENWLTFKHHSFQAQDLCIPKNKKSGKAGGSPPWMSKGAYGKTQMEEESLWNVKKGSGHLAGV